MSKELFVKAEEVARDLGISKPWVGKPQQQEVSR